MNLLWFTLIPTTFKFHIFLFMPVIEYLLILLLINYVICQFSETNFKFTPKDTSVLVELINFIPGEGKKVKKS